MTEETKTLADDMVDHLDLPDKPLIKAVQAIEVKETKSLSLFSRRLYNHLLALAYKNLPKDMTHEVNMASLRMGKSVNTEVKKSVQELQTTLIEYNYLNREGKEIWGSSTLLSDCEMNLGDGVLYYTFSPRIRELMHTPAQYAEISLKVIYAFRSKYSLVLYELISARYRMNKTHEVFPTDAFRVLMTVPEGKLKSFRDFNKRALEPAIREINAFSPFQVTVDPDKFKKRGRKITHITVEWTKKQKDAIEDALENIDDDLPLFATRTAGRYLDNDTETNRKALDYLLRNTQTTRKWFKRAIERSGNLVMNTPQTFNAPENWVSFVAEDICKQGKL